MSKRGKPPPQWLRDLRAAIGDAPPIPDKEALELDLEIRWREKNIRLPRRLKDVLHRWANAVEDHEAQAAQWLHYLANSVLALSQLHAAITLALAYDLSGTELMSDVMADYESYVGETIELDETDYGISERRELALAKKFLRSRSRMNPRRRRMA